MDTTIIELRQSNATSVNTNINPSSGQLASADYNCTFDPPITLNDGDQVSIKSVFLDTRTQGAGDGRIHIDESNNKFDIQSILYLTNYRGDATGGYDTNFTFNDATGASADRKNHPDGFKYVMAYNVAQASSNACLELTELIIKKGSPPRKREQLNSSLLFTDPNGKNISVPITIPASSAHNADLEVRLNDGTSAGAPLKIHYQSTKSPPATTFDPFDITFSDPQHIANGGISLEPDFNDPPYTNLAGTAGQVIADDNFQPYLVRVSFDIPNGDYEPASLAKLITDNLTTEAFSQSETTPINLATTVPNFSPKIQTTGTSQDIYTGTNFPTKNPYFTSVSQVRTDADYGFTGASNEVFFIAEDGLSVLQPINNPSRDYIIGANQMTLQFDPNLNKFLFTSQHSEIISSVNGADTGGLQFRQLGATGKFFLASQHSGVAFHSFPNTDSGKICQKLLFEDLGFDNSIFINTQPIDKASYGSPATITDTRSFITHIREGQNTTGGLRSIDAFFQKTDTTYDVASTMVDKFIQTENINSIVGDKTQKAGDGGELSNGYFLVELNGLPNQKVSYSQNSSNMKATKSQAIKSIVGRYYATADYTEDSGTGSIPYIYSGVPMYLSNLNVRVCDPDGTPSTALGTDNTVFIEIVSQRPQPVPQIDDKK